ncbi:hypothetical protein HMPREF1143_1313 [Peptoanaerobacter stomatis]|uniref:Uncharacterized protein n=1 Tax=Peptoanaerobacter stomatis TaxID=796937 RepID=J6HR83_9FIRM|nr:hypothetical protein HMPREF1143_1313 [Peptoanaerobacter stomatis]
MINIRDTDTKVNASEFMLEFEANINVMMIVRNDIARLKIGSIMVVFLLFL